MGASNVWAEDEIGRKWDRCFADGILKLGGGIFIGTVFSLLFNRRRWPIITGAGFGLGMAYSNCQKDVNTTLNTCRIKAKETDKKDKKK